MKVKITNELLDRVYALKFVEVAVGVDASGRLLTAPHPSGPDGTFSKRADYILRDSVDKGFGVRISPGAISFFVQRKMGGSTSVKRTLGKYRSGTATVADARVKAQIWLGLMADGKDPLAEKIINRTRSKVTLEDARLTFEKVFDDYILTNVNGAKSSDRDRRTVKKWLLDQKSEIEREKLRSKQNAQLSLLDTPFLDIDEAAVAKAIQPWFDKDPVTQKYQRDIASGWKIYRCCRAAYGLQAEKKRMAIDGNPFSVWRKSANLPKVGVRSKYLKVKSTGGEKWFKKLLSLRNDPTLSISVVSDFLTCVLLWGGRKTETQLLKWEDVDFEEKIVSFVNTKNKVVHKFPLTPFAESILAERRRKSTQTNTVLPGDWVFASRVHGKHIVDIRNVLALCEAESGQHIGAHDLRRTFATELAGQTKDIAMVKVALNHASARNDVTLAHYVQEQIELLRPIYETRETRLLLLGGIAPIDIPAGSDDALQAQIDALWSQPKSRELLVRKILATQK